jgi:small subunit ribosomal protein S18
MEKETKTPVVEHFDYKDTNKLKAHINPHARMMGKKRTGLKAREQRLFAQAVKRARFMALVPYVSE